MAVLAVFLPLLGAILAGALAFADDSNEQSKARAKVLSQWITCGALLLSALCAIFVFVDVALYGNHRSVELFAWMDSATLEISWALRLDTLSAVMMLVVTLCSSMIHVYSVGYMDHDPSVPRFMAYLNLFTFFMLMLVTADNLAQMYFGWEGVGLASYLLIGFWYDRPSANSAAMKAFIVNRVGDFGFALGMFGVFLLFDSISLETVFAAAPGKADATLNLFGAELHALTAICLLLFVGAMGKSAQLGLHTWLPDAMEGPTPVSALIHAATMVTAGVFMVSRMSPLFEHSETALTVVTIVGASTCFFAATVGCFQNDIKRVIAYSTCSQLGYMFFACGVSAYAAGIFHLTTHAFFKALLFLGAGSVIHAMSDEQDMRKMGGLWKMVPVTYALMLIGSLSLAGIPPFAGFFSKDIVLESAYAAHSAVGTYAFWLGIAAAFMTAFYSWRLLIMTFHGSPRGDEKVVAHVHESPKVMLIPMAVLAVGAVIAGVVGYGSFVGDGLDEFWGESIFVLEGHHALHDAHHVPSWVKFAPLLAGLGGIGLAIYFYGMAPAVPARIYSFPGRIGVALRAVYRFVFNKWYFDELYDAVFVRPAMRLGRDLWKTGDGELIDAMGPDGIAAATVGIAKRAARLETGYLYHYAFAMLIGVFILVSGYLLLAGG